MDSDAVATSLIRAGTLLAIVLLGQLIAVRHLPLDNVPGVLRGRVTRCTQARPWLFATAIAITATGLALHLV